ncbi:MurR/RpiR family transcriptional regulator [Saccharospirillum salsuginis]|uniref:RpiR family transcriptional regulator n=1 Tax=Saccharospirillum salsuginis TaxID=418750 RepID=A0A918K1L3_9GAMM|nr:MurR/RpiR family transcriptional regulator [Saccharospirillum salsuginis]GGX41821.1 RpiR family transcriptional regulator [Saccharospirillum salsuginis]
MNNKNILVQIQSNVASLSPALKRIAQYVSESPDTVIYQTITELSEQSKSSEASVIRFCRDLGFSSFADFKMALALDLTNREKRGRRREPDSGGMIAQYGQNAVSALDDTVSLLNEDAVKSAVKALNKARGIDLYGVGASSVTAAYGEYRLLRLGMRPHLFSDMHLGLMSASQLGAQDLAICISSSGSTVDIVKAARIAKDRGATVLAITNTVKSPLASVATLTLIASSPESPLTAGKLASKVGQLLILDILFGELEGGKKTFESAFQETADATGGLSY